METVPLSAVLHRVLGSDILGTADVPVCDNSSMDGFALRAVDVKNAGEKSRVRLTLSGESAAGDGVKPFPGQGTAVRIMTGAPIPTGADAVIELEQVVETDGVISVPAPVKAGRNIRRVGEDVRKGEKILHRGVLLRSGHLGLLASQGFVEVPVARRPTVAILTTGNELIGANDPLVAGKVRNSNATVLSALVQESGGSPVDLGTVGDDEEAIARSVREGLKSDILVTSGGVSVGKYDHVLRVLESAGVAIKFWKVNMKPGMPTAFGVSNDGRPVFALPGNPVSTAVTFLQFVRPAIRHMMGMSDDPLRRLRARLAHDIKKSDGKRHFVRGVVSPASDGLTVMSTGTQSSGVLSSMAAAHCLIDLPESARDPGQGTIVEIELL